MTFLPIWGKYQTAMVVYAGIGTFDNTNREQLQHPEQSQKILAGSIYFEDWDKKAIYDFVLDALKFVYQACGEEIERRKELIAKEEEAVGQYRRPK